MKKQTIILTIVILIIDVFGYSQNEKNKVMTSFIPKSNAYDIYYPKNFKLIEDREGIVTITDSNSELNITISSYSIEKKISEEKLIDQLNGFVKNYYDKEIVRENWNSYKTKFDVLVELKISDEKINWVWWGVVNKKRLVLISINKENTITTDDLNLLLFMINNLIINK